MVVTRFGGMTHDGSLTVNEGTQLIRLAVGDMASWVTQPCACGAMTPRLRDVRPEVGPPCNYEVSFHESPVRSGHTQRIPV